MLNAAALGFAGGPKVIISTYFEGVAVEVSYPEV
jgi:hypothetical protein